MKYTERMMFMKNALKGYVLGLLTVVFVVGSVAYANSNIRIFIDGKEFIATDVNGTRVYPILENGTTYLPVRAIANAFGKDVYWDGTTSTVYLGERIESVASATEKLSDLTNIGQGWGETNELVDNYGNYYSYALRSNGASTKTHVYGHGNYTGKYLLDGKYSRLQGTIYVQKGEDSEDSTGLTIMLDGKDVYTSPIITKTSYPINIDIPISGGNVLEIENTGAPEFSVFLGNAELCQ